MGKTAVQFEAVCGPKFITFWDDVRFIIRRFQIAVTSEHVADFSCQRTLPIVYIAFRSEDIGR